MWFYCSSTDCFSTEEFYLGISGIVYQLFWKHNTPPNLQQKMAMNKGKMYLEIIYWWQKVKIN